MNDHYISNELYAEICSLPEIILIQLAILLRDQWINNPRNGNALMEMLIVAEALEERGIDFPDPPFSEKTTAAIQTLREACEGNDIFFVTI